MAAQDMDDRLPDVLVSAEGQYTELQYNGNPNGDTDSALMIAFNEDQDDFDDASIRSEFFNSTPEDQAEGIQSMDSIILGVTSDS